MRICNEKVRLGLRFLTLICLTICTAGLQPARAAVVWYVTPDGSDAGTCTTPADPCGTIAIAIAKAGSGDTIYVAVGNYTGNLPGAVVLITKNLNLSGGWDSGFTTQTGMSTIDGQGTRQDIYVNKATTRIENFIIQNGNPESGYGGGIENHSGSVTIDHSHIKNNFSRFAGGGVYSFGTLILNDTIVSDNDSIRDPCCSGGDGGGMFVHGTATLNNSIVSNNRSSFSGSGINLNSGTLILNNSTVSGNSSPGEAISVWGTAELNNSTIAGNAGDGIRIIYGTLQIRNSIMANNSNFDCYFDPTYSPSMTSLGYNLIETQQGCTLVESDLSGIDPGLEGLMDNGGPTYTHALLPGSPAINAGNPAGCQGSAGLLTTDQRGYLRSDRCDIGAFEMKPLDASYMLAEPTQAPTGSQVRFTMGLVNSSDSDITDLTVTDVLPATLAYQDGSLAATSGNASYSAGVITWTGSVNAANQVTITFLAMIGQTVKSVVIENEAVFTQREETFRLKTRIHVPPPYLTFLPQIVRPRPGIIGHVSFNGEPAAGVQLSLCERSPGSTGCGVSYSVNTDEKGDFEFTEMPSASPGETYSVSYYNQAGPEGNDHLSYWYTRSITNYMSGQSVYIGSFDIANAPLSSPVPGDSVSLPATFQWTKRPASPNDSYQIQFLGSNWTPVYTTPLLGYVDIYVMNSLPPGLVTGSDYFWAVVVNSPDGGYGVTRPGYARINFR
jgi:uncharacterized repeat protein (TIGR01451 family)